MTLVLPFAIGALASSAKTMGVLALCQKLNDTAWKEPEPQSLRRGVLADGLATVLSGVIGTLGVNSMPSAVAIPAATGLASRRVAYAIAAILGILAFIPLASLTLAIMPRCVMGPIAIYTGCFVIINGMQTIASVQLDQSKTLAMGLGFLGGISAEIFPQLASGAPALMQPLLSSSLALGTLIALAANLVLRLNPAVSARGGT
jgi:NCS2 family nucleobase:cation symporter-2